MKNFVPILLFLQSNCTPGAIIANKPYIAITKKIHETITVYPAFLSAGAQAQIKKMSMEE
ncbi:hypothetical protein EJ377_15450 [Chryseobacterium arthrosphaerae]|uniref:Uncharacterized protein n=1 Tax=Chryseobacterium arthrosphaerae TaxID=651561 RepID=A0A3S0PNH4_9FLAO|nr:hypothetical protein EJ377_15450 [Chryseobacterium arthrosphaerae]